MSAAPVHLLEGLASIEEQRRYVVGATVDEYLLPEEILSDALLFCEQVEVPSNQATLSNEQRAAVARLRDSIRDLSGCTELYDRSNIYDLIESDKCWAVMRDRAAEVVSQFQLTDLR